MTDNSMHISHRPRLLLVYPATHKLGWERNFQLPYHSLQQVAACVPDSWDVSLIDELQDEIPSGRDYDLVGITSMTHQAVRAYQLADRFRAEGVKVIMGGMHPTVLPEEAMQHADAVVVGEAEPVMAGLLDDYLAGRLKPLYKAPIAEGNLLDVPWARRDVLAGKRYLTTQTIQASRGCPYNCAFCTVTPYFGNRYRYRSHEDILAQIASFDRKLVVFLDDNLLGNPAKAIPVLEGMADMGIRWGSQTSLRFAENSDLLKLVARSGCIGLFVGIESVTGEYAHIPKLNGHHSQKELIKRVQDVGIILEASFVFGFEDHDQGIFEKTARFIEDCKPSVPTFNVLTPYPGTEFFRQFDQQGRLLHKDWSRYNHSDVVFRPRLMTPEQLKRGWVMMRREAFSYGSILSRATQVPGRLLTNLAYNLLRRGPNRRLVLPEPGSYS
ncbi:MAG TPA: radical SAM protein [Deltaproteobacteria bacterium]|nr:radical SAM protein [Deltaproteobacteria bacterium]HQB39735.1 radical SAM protein [Deltaproteobacteria bacterium]